MSKPSAPQSDAIQRTFTKLSGAYGGHFLAKHTGTSFCFRRRLELALELARPASGRLLDCAAGTGEITSAILQTGRFHHADVVDISSAMLDRARARLSAELGDQPGLFLRFTQSDIFKFRSEKGAEQFDMVLCLGLIAHTGRLTELLEHVREMLAPGGRIILQTTLADHPGTRVVRALSQERYHRRHGYRISYFRLGDILQAAQAAGLKVEAVRRMSVGVPFGDRLWAWGNYHLERLLQHWSSAHGSDALFLLRRE
jgi:ubiquinone/menaquinone biosynthesis C-methylase UbiE